MIEKGFTFIQDWYDYISRVQKIVPGIHITTWWANNQYHVSYPQVYQRSVES